MEPRSNVTYFILLGLTQNPKEQKVIFVMFLFFYILTVVGNLLIVATVAVSKTLNSPMHFFLASLSFIDLVYSSSASPRLISDLLFGENTISLESCMTQLFTEHFLGGSEISRLLVMAYGRCVAVCKPCIIWWPSVAICKPCITWWPSVAICKPLHYLVAICGRL